MLTSGLVGYLLTQSAVTAQIAGSNAIQPIPATEPYPCITYQMVSDVPEYTLNGVAGLSQARLVFDCFAPNGRGGYLVARNIALAVKAALSGYSGTLPDGTRVFFCEVVNVNDNFDLDGLLSRSSVHVLVTYGD